MDVLDILDELDEAPSLRRPVLPSGWTCLGLVQHLAVDIERFWFRGVVAGEAAVTEAPRRRHGTMRGRSPPAFRPPMCSPPTATRSPEPTRSSPVRRAGQRAGWWPRPARRVAAPTISGEIARATTTETACHAGHLDAAREMLDVGCGGSSSGDALDVIDPTCRRQARGRRAGRVLRWPATIGCGHRGCPQEPLCLGEVAGVWLVVVRGEVVLGESGEGVDGCGPVECAVGSVVIVEVDEAVVGGSALGV